MRNDPLCNASLRNDRLLVQSPPLQFVSLLVKTLGENCSSTPLKRHNNSRSKDDTKVLLLKKDPVLGINGNPGKLCMCKSFNVKGQASCNGQQQKTRREKRERTFSGSTIHPLARSRGFLFVPLPFRLPPPPRAARSLPELPEDENWTPLQVVPHQLLAACLLGRFLFCVTSYSVACAPVGVKIL